MGKRITLTGLFVSGVLLWGGAQGVYTSLSNPKPNVLSCAEFGKSNGDALWYQLKDCSIDLTQAVYFENPKVKGEITKLYVPILGAHESDPINLAISTYRQDWIAVMKELRAKQNDDVKLKEYIHTNISHIIFKTDLEGLIKYGLEADSSAEKQFKNIKGNLAQNFAVLADGSKPNLAGSAGAFGIGLGILGFMGLRAMRRRL